MIILCYYVIIQQKSVIKHKNVNTTAFPTTAIWTHFIVNYMRQRNCKTKPSKAQFLNWIYELKSGTPMQVRLGCYYWVNDDGFSASAKNYKEWTITVNFAKGLPAADLMEYYFQDVVKLCTRDASIKVCFIFRFIIDVSAFLR